MTSPSADHPPEIQELAARLRLSTARLARVLRQQAGTGLSASQTSVMASLNLHGPLTLGRLARVEQVTPPTITKIVTRLEEDGLVARQVDPTDRRIVRVSVTDEGRRRLEHSRERRNAWLAERLVALSSAERQRLEAVLPLLEGMTATELPPSDVAEANGAAGASR
jgi:DNA-binding MarR family transcriptional regulator